MKYYERHLGAYAKDTAHLSALEHGMYGLLLDRYYATEQAIPEDDVYRISKAHTKREKLACDAVLRDFFNLFEKKFFSKRCEEELTRARHRIQKAQENGRKGGRPPKEQKTGWVNSGFVLETGLKATYLLEVRKKDSEAKASAGLQPSPRDELFGLVEPTAKQFKLSDRHTRSLFGKAVKLAGGDHAAIVELVRQAMNDPPLDIQPWLIKACTPKSIIPMYGLDLTDDDVNRHNPHNGARSHATDLAPSGRQDKNRSGFSDSRSRELVQGILARST